jgi:hypothetical protein
MVLVPVASVLTQPCCLAAYECQVCDGGRATYGNGSDEEAPRREVEMLRRRMLLWGQYLSSHRE